MDLVGEDRFRGICLSLLLSFGPSYFSKEVALCFFSVFSKFGLFVPAFVYSYVCSPKAILLAFRQR